jgi:hypothetical protein
MKIYTVNIDDSDGYTWSSSVPFCYFLKEEQALALCEYLNELVSTLHKKLEKDKYKKEVYTYWEYKELCKYMKKSPNQNYDHLDYGCYLSFSTGDLFLGELP